MPLPGAPVQYQAPLLAAGLLLAAAAPPALQAQEVVAGRPPMYARVERARVYLSPLTTIAMRLDLGDQPDPTGDRVEGIGLSLGADFIVKRHLALWIDGHAGAVTGVEQRAEGATTRLRQVRGTFRALGAGASGLLSSGELTGMLGLGLFAAAAEWEGFHNAFGRDVDTNATLFGLLAAFRADYTFRNGFFVGAGLELGLGQVGAREARGAAHPTGEFTAIYVPLGWTY